MPKTRRRFLKVMATAATGIVLVNGVAWRYGRTVAADRYRRLVELDRSDPGGDLEDGDVAAMMAVTFALVGREIDDSRYDDFFRWKAKNAGGYRALYARFRAALDARAKQLQAASFAEAKEEVQLAALAKARAVRDMINADDKLGGLQFALFDRDWLLFERYVIREVLTLFARTDAWVISGYGQPPGTPRTVEAYFALPEVTAEPPKTEP